MYLVFFVTHAALHRSLSGVNQQVGLEVRLPREAAVTQGTTERPLIKVGGFVFLARASVSEDLPTVLAFKRPLPCVYIHVISKRPLV